MKISLVFTPNVLNLNFRELSFRDKSIGYIPPLSLLTVAAILEQEGVFVDLIDMEAEQLTYEETLDRINRFSPDLLGFTLTTTSFRPALTWINRFKQATGLPVIVGGDHVRLYPIETMSHMAIDYCIVGEAELPLPCFIRAFRSGASFSGIKSLGFRDHGRLHLDRTVQSVDNIDTVPFPARHLIKNERYSNILSRRKNFTAVISSRGCPFHCSFCNANHQQYRARSPGNFVDEIEFNLTHYDIHDFDIYDSTFTADKQRVAAICHEIRKRKLDVTFSVRSRVDVVTREMITALKTAGCHTIMYGIESSSQEILSRMNKGISPEQVSETVAYTRQAGIETLGFFMFGYPGESVESIEDTIRFALALPLDYAQFTVLLPFPETEIYDYYREQGLDDYWSLYTLDPAQERLIELSGTEVTRQQASAYVTQAYKRFYFRPRIIWKRLKMLGSFGAIKKLASGAIGILRE